MRILRLGLLASLLLAPAPPLLFAQEEDAEQLPTEPPPFVAQPKCLDENQVKKARRYAILAYTDDVNDWCSKHQPDPGAVVEKAVVEAVKKCKERFKKSGPRFKNTMWPIFIKDRFGKEASASQETWESLCDNGWREKIEGVDDRDVMGEAEEEFLFEKGVDGYKRNREKFAQQVLDQLKPAKATWGSDELTADDLKRVSPSSDLDEFQKLVPTTDYTGDFKSKSGDLAATVKTRQEQLAKVKATVGKAVEAKPEAPSSTDTAKKMAGTGAKFGGEAGGAAFDGAGAGAAAGKLPPGVAPPPTDGTGVPGGSTTFAGAGLGAGGTPGKQPDLGYDKAPNKDWPKDEKEKALSKGLAAGYQKAWGMNTYGVELTSAMAKEGIPYPPITIRTEKLSDGSVNKGAMAVYSSDTKAININAYYVKQAYPWAKGMNDGEIQQYLVDHPEAMNQLSKDTQATMFHENWHAYQGGYCPLHGQHGIPNKNYLDGEVHAYAYEARYATEMFNNDPKLLTSTNTFVKSEAATTFNYNMNPDKWRSDTLKTYYKAYGSNASEISKVEPGMDAKIAAEKKKCNCDSSAELDKLAASKADLKKADDFYKEQREKEKKYYTKNVEARSDYLLTMGESNMNGNYTTALQSFNQAAYVAFEGCAKEWLEANWSSPLCAEYKATVVSYCRQNQKLLSMCSGKATPDHLTASYIQFYKQCDGGAPAVGSKCSAAN